MSSLQQFQHLRIPLADVKSITNDFSDESIIGKGGFGIVYKGQLSHGGQLISVAIRRLHDKYGQGMKEFLTDIVTRASLNHENLVSLVGFCDEDGEKIIIDKHAVNQSLDKHLSNPSLTWMQRLRICVCVARLLSYLHYETGYSYDVIHRDIKSSKVLLDENWEAKVGGFGLCIKTPATRRHRLVLEDAFGTLGYIDPTYHTTGSVTHKSDVYSFGVVLFEVLCGRRVFVGKDMRDRYLIPIARQAYESGTLDDHIIDPNILKQMQPESLTIFSETAYHCLKVQRTQRPDMKRVVERLEKAMELQRKHENPVPKETPFEGTSSNYLKGKDMELFKIGFDAIKLATDDFAEINVIGRGGFGTVYKAEIEHFDPSAMKGELESEVPKRHSIVAIKHIREHKTGEQGFITEVKTLTMCKHPNIVSLLGFCYEHPHMFLVYEYVPNGSLEDYLGGQGKMTNLTWVQRIQICIDVACGLDYLHTTSENKQKIIHRDVKSANILLDTNWVAKIADFGLSKFHPDNHKASTLITDTIAGTPFYRDPEYEKKGKLKKASDIYSFGVVLFEILSGKLAYDPFFTRENKLGLAPIARQHFVKGTITKMVDPKLMEETDEETFSISTGPDKNSLQTFSKIAYQCLEETQAQRPKMEDVINQLNKTLEFQISRKDNLQISLTDIKLATQEFDASKVIGSGGFGNVYKGEVNHANGHKVIAARRFDMNYGQGTEFFRELEILLEYKHENVIGLVGYCDEGGEKIIAYEYALRGSLDRWLNNDSLTWVKRLQIGIDVASGLEFLHGGEEVVIHKDLKSRNILLTEDWEAKVADFGISSISTINQDVDYVIENVVGTVGYMDPLYLETGVLTKESDIYSFGAVLCELLSGKLIYKNTNGKLITQIPMHKRRYEEGKVDEMVFEGIKEQILPQSLAVFAGIAFQCLRDERKERPTATEVVAQLKKALEFQEDHEIWEPKLPKDYKEIIKMSTTPEVYSTKKKEDLYNIFSRGILVQQDKVLLSFDGHGERNEMISATTFSYMNSCPYKWQSLPESRFHKVAQMLDISDLMIKIKAEPQFLSPNAVYGVYLVFKFCDTRNFSSKPMYVNLKYKRESKTLNSYFATRRDDEWMIIELYRFQNEEDDVVFEFLLESLSSYYCKDDVIYVEGIDFRAINNVMHEETNNSKEVQQDLSVRSKVDQVQQLAIKSEVIFERSQNVDDGEKLYLVSEVNKKKQLMLSAKAALCNFSDLKNFSSKPSTESRFQEVIELLPQQVFRINCRIKSQMLSTDTTYMCYLVFKLSEKSQGFHCPVEVRDLLHRENKEADIIYFVSPSPWNLHDITWVPEQREDGWMEVNVWKFNSSDEIKNDCISLNLKLVSYEGTMSGLIICGLEFRPE